MKLLRTSSARFVPQNEYRLPQYRVRMRVARTITLVDGRSTLPLELPSDVR